MSFDFAFWAFPQHHHSAAPKKRTNKQESSLLYPGPLQICFLSVGLSAAQENQSSTNYTQEPSNRNAIDIRISAVIAQLAPY